MRARTVAALILPLIAAGCGGSSTPTSPTGTPARIDLVPGAYALTLTMSETGKSVCNGGLCVSLFLLCTSTGGPTPAAPATLTAPVQLERSGDTVTIRPDDPSATFRVQLNIIGGTTVGGTMAGQFRSGNAQVSVGDGRFPAVATGTILETTVTGYIDGLVSMGGYSCANDGHSWTLARRP